MSEITCDLLSAAINTRRMFTVVHLFSALKFPSQVHSMVTQHILLINGDPASELVCKEVPYPDVVSKVVR